MTTIIFIVSFLVICSMIISKIVEIKMEKTHFLSNTFSVWDNKIHNFIDVIVFKYNRYKKIANIFLFEFLPSYIFELLVKMKDHVSKKYYSRGDEFRGRRVLRGDGSVSFFLERLSDDKTSIDGHKI